jgi:hypothetical protein
MGMLGGSFRIKRGGKGKDSLFESWTCQRFVHEHHVADADVAMHVSFLVVVQVALMMNIVNVTDVH